jgi:SulP family sulfate permease
LNWRDPSVASAVIDLNERKELFAAAMMVEITLAANLAAAFLVGLIVTDLLKSERLSV